MTNVYLADHRSEERNALRLLLKDLKMSVIGEADDWSTTVDQVPPLHPDMLLVDWELLPNAPSVVLEELRRKCSSGLVIVLISHLDARQQAALSSGADTFISKSDMAERVAERLIAAAASIHLE
jgi:DNA-binding NarL/FixJ family response regulator